MEQERERPKRPKHRAQEAASRELSPPPLPPRLADFDVPKETSGSPKVQEEVKTSTTKNDETKENVENAEAKTSSTPIPTVEEPKIASRANLEPTVNAEKEREARISQSSSSGLVRELPFDALMPRTPTAETPIEVKPIYPSIAEATAPSIATAPPAYLDVNPSTEWREQQPRLYPELQDTLTATAPAVREFVSMYGERELLSEAQLLEFYQNDLLDNVDDFVDDFVVKEIKPSNCLHDLLQKFREACDCTETNRTVKEKASAHLIEVNNSVWSVEEHEVSQTGRCGEDRPASGKTTYKKAKFIPDRLTELNTELANLTKLELDEGYCCEVRARSLALQIQWIVVELNQQFLTAQQITMQSVPILIPIERNESYRRELIGALSDLFYHLRFPLLPQRFRDSVCGWITELSSALLKAITFNDQAFLLSQILRSQPPLNWAVPLVQTFINVPTLDPTLAIDSFMALLKNLMEPIQRREEFLGVVKAYYKGDNEWSLVDDEGDADNMEITDVKDLDMIALLNQFDIKSLYSITMQKFTAIYPADKRRIILSLIGFTLMLLRILNEGLRTYSTKTMKNVGKKISDGIRKAVQTICTYWRLASKDGQVADAFQLQNEINRLVLQAIYYITSKTSVGLWQFVVDFPFFALTDIARLRCLILLRNPSKYTVGKLYEIDDANLLNILNPTIGSSGTLLQDLDNIGVSDRNYALTAMGQIVAEFEKVDCQHFTNELINVCFMEQTREAYSKVGSEIVSHILERKPQIFPSIVRYMNRKIDNLDAYAVDILSKASLLKCSLPADEVGSILGKFLLRDVEHPANKIARMILSGLDWGAEEDLFLPLDVHSTCAQSVVSAHFSLCKTRNSSIGKSITKSAKLMLKLPDAEQDFDRFCWNMLIRLKITPKPLATEPKNDLTAFFVYLQEKCLSSPETFMESGQNFWIELVNGSCFYGAGVILLKLIEKFPTRIHLFTASEKFKNALDTLLQADSTPYIHQFFNVGDKFPGPILRLLSTGLSNQFDRQDNQIQLKQLLNGWMQLLSCKRPTLWTGDKSTLHLIGVVSRTAFINDPIECSGLVDLLLMSYKAILNAWKDAPKGVLSWFSSHVPPRLIETSHLHYSPWASLLMLKAETQAHTKFYESLNANFAKHPKRELEDAVRRTASKTQWNLGVPQLPYYRWLEMCTQDSIVNDQFVYPLALQQLVTVLFGRTKVNGKSYCFGDRYYECSTSKHLFDELTKSLSKVEKNTDVPRLGSFYRAVGIWLCIPALYAPNFNNFHDVPMDFLLQRIFTGDSHPWVELADVPKLKERVTAEAKASVFALFCHLVHPPPVASSAATHPKNIIELFQHLDIKSIVTQNFPAIPVHQNLPSSGRLSFDEAQSTTMVNGRVNVLVEDLIKISKTFLESKDKVETLNEEYGKKFHNLYVHSQTTLSIQMKCGAFLSAHCKRPGVQNVTVNASRYDSDVAMAMNENRLKRENIITELLQGLDNTSIISARMEYACYTLQSYTKNMEQYQPPPLYSSKVAEMPVDSRVERVQNTGRCLFYQLCEHSNRPEVLLFPALTNAVETCLLHLGVTFIAERSGEQMNLLRIVLAGHPLDVTRFFTPHCVSSDELLKLYMELSSGIRNASTKEASMALLKRLDIQYAGEKLPSNQFSSLLPVIFENLASVPNGTPLHELCGTHFEHAMFHGFPHNFVNGFRLLLSGCDSHCVPVSLFQTIIQRFSMDEFITTSNKAISGTKCTITIELAFQSIQVIAEQLQKSRHELATRLYSVWNFDYLDPVLQCADFFVRSVVCQQFISTDLPSAIENDLNRSFLLVLTIFGPLLEPVGHSNLAPFNPADNELAQNVVVSRFVDLLTWLPHSTYLPPGSETIEKLFFDYFAKTLSNLQRAGSSHIYTVYENKCVSFNWARLWPNLLDLSSLEKLLTEGSPDVAPFVVDIVVRIQWREVVQNMNGQPTDAHRAFYSILINVFARTVCRSTNYAKSRASVEKLLRDFLTLGHWHFVKSSAIEKVAQYIAASFPTDFLTNTNDILVAFSNLWRESCCFTTTRSMYVAADSPEMEIRTIALKQSMYLHAYVHLLLRSTLTKEDQCRLYKELLDKCYLLIGAACSGKTEKQTEDELQQFAPIAKELIAFWPQIPKEKHVDNFFQTITQWLTDHPESVLLLLVMHVAMSVLGKPAPQLGLKLLDKCVMIYFKRKLSCNWQEVCKWLTIPTNMREWLYTTPSVDAGIEPRFLTLNAHLLNEMSTLSSAPEEERVMRRLADYLQSIKPKYIQSEVSFLVVLEKWQRMVIRQYSNGVPIGIANEQLEVYISYLRKMFSDDKGVSFFNVKAMFSRKPLFPLRLQVVAQISSLYLTQQQTSLSQPPRQTGNQPVLCSRISAFREMQQEKKYQEIENISTVFQFALPYFTQPESHTLSNASTLLYRISDFLYTDSNKLLRHLDHSV